jgi:hypothetical protein
MTKRLHTQITIAATVAQVWQVLTDFDAYPAWNPFITSAQGRAAAGERLTLRMQPEVGRAMTFQPTVQECVPGRRLRWLGRWVLPGLFDGEHTFTIEPGTDGVHLTQQEDFRGLLTPLLARQLDRGTLPAFEHMNQALKQRAEHLGLPSRRV